MVEGGSMTSATTERRFMTVKEVSQIYGLAEGSIYNMVSQRRIPFTKFGRLTKFDRYKLDQWTEKNSVKVRPSGLA
jgi:excisionase family DNA binding protein